MFQKEVKDIYDELLVLFKIKNKLPLIFVEDDGYLGYLRRVKYKTVCYDRIDSNNKRHRHFGTTGWIDDSIRLDSRWVSNTYDENILPPCIRTLIHELAHQVTTGIHSKRFYREYRRMCNKYIAYCREISYKDAKSDIDFQRYINRWKLS